MDADDRADLKEDNDDYNDFLRHLRDSAPATYGTEEDWHRRQDMILHMFDAED